MEHVREPNPALRRHMDEAGWNGPALASALVRVARESGIRVGYDRSTVAHWLTGTQPRPPGPRLLEEVFTRKLGRPVSMADLGFGAEHRWPPPGGGHREESDPVHALLRLHWPQGRPGTTEPPHPALYEVRPLPGPRASDQAGPSGSPGPVGARITPVGGRIGPGHGRAVRELTAFGTRHYDAHGGTPARSVLAAGLREQALPWLRHSGGSRAHTELLTATAQLVRVLGRTYADDHLQGEAQRHYRLAYRLAAEADDPTGQAMALRDQSTLAGSLRHPRYAADLAAAALAHLPAAAPPGVRAFVLAQYAVATARDGRPRPALHALDEARRLIPAAPAGDDPLGYPEAALLYQAAQVHRALRDPAAALSALRASLRLRPDGEHRTIGRSLLELAHLELDTGDVHHARRTHTAYLALPPGPASALAQAGRARLESRLATLRERPSPARSPLR
ncbi:MULTISPECIES: hypothetical protein [Kitasatospora]|uniref:Regulatory protein n=1 Tax=Kitasatospora setae (strain ATCC 33774 / DSM 43861 / JCM 3304 / KCC A-0304 / NBRC 14216 / KM-6054) TaxID=452652 RepID=E4NJY4_KITSK|nr:MULTISPECIES: hypothetical protein [Kitasatospora]BAJ33282.1 hypothetical protein KSE_75290 [Kitasatospora setae KM-6054]